jgi:2'-5' RNA ligase
MVAAPLPSPLPLPFPRLLIIGFSLLAIVVLPCRRRKTMPTVRTFIAVDLPEEVRDYLARCQERLRAAGANVKWTRPEQIHLTLVFLGNVPADELDLLAEAVREAVAGFGPLALRAGGTGQFPPGGRPRVVWVGVQVEEGDLMGLQQAVARAAAPFAEKQEHRGFHPHLTLGRVRQGGRGHRGRRGGGGPGDLAALGRAVVEAAEESGPAFDAEEVVVFQSDLGREGPTYTPLARLPLEKA